MTQEVFDDIDPNVTSGTDLATLLNEFKASWLTNNSGNAAPAYASIGTTWLDNSVADKLTEKIYDGSQWIVNYTLDTAAHTISYGGNNATASISINRTDALADMIEMYRETGTQTDGGLIFSQKNDASTKKTMAKFKMVSDNIADTAEEASFLFQAMVAGTMIDIMSLSNTAIFFEALKGSGERMLVVDANGNVSAVNAISEYNIFDNGSAASADLGTYTINAPLTLAKSSVSTELIDSTQVFKSIATAAAETFETEVVSLRNIDTESPFIVALKANSTVDWEVDLVDSDTLTVLVTSTIPAYAQTANESRLHKFFASIPSGTVNVKAIFRSTAAGSLLFDTIEMYTWAAKDEPLYFSIDILNNQTNTDMFLIANRKNKLLKIEGQVIIDTDDEFADAIYSGYISNNGTVWRVGKESTFEHEADETGIELDMSTNTLRYSNGDLPGANHVGKFHGTITRVL